MLRCELFNDDCIKIMNQLIKRESVDLIISDPPYLMNYKTGMRKNKQHRFCSPILNDSNPEFIKNMIKCAYNILKDNSAFYCFCNSNHVDFFKAEIEKFFKVKNILIWIKNNHTAGDLKGAFGKKTEFIIYAVKGRHILNGKRDSDTLYYNRVAGNKQLHQNQKPVELIEFLIKKSSKLGQTVLDPVMGSGTCGVACKNLNRNFIGIELDKEYYEIAEKRIDGEV